MSSIFINVVVMVIVCLKFILYFIYYGASKKEIFYNFKKILISTLNNIT